MNLKVHKNSEDSLRLNLKIEQPLNESETVVSQIVKKKLEKYVEAKDKLALLYNKVSVAGKSPNLPADFKAKSVYKEFLHSTNNKLNKEPAEGFLNFLDQKIEECQSIIKGTEKISLSTTTSLLFSICTKWVSKKLSKNIASPIKKLVLGLFFPLRGQDLKSDKAKEAEQRILSSQSIPGAVTKIPPYERKEIEVKLKENTRHLEAWHNVPPKGITRNNTTVVIFHGNGMVGAEMYKTASYYLTQGYDVLMPSIGGYPGSPGVETSEESIYQDVEAIKLFLENELRVTNVAYHGTSIGGVLALQAGTNINTDSKLKTQFVVADKTFSSAAEVGENMLLNEGKPLLSKLVKNVIKKGFPAQRIIQVPGEKETLTDGMNNLEKVKQLALNNIPLVVIDARQDDFMGREEVLGKRGGDREFNKNFGDDLCESYNKMNHSQAAHITVESWGHHDHITIATHDVNEKLKKALRFLPDLSVDNSAKIV